MAEAGTPFQLFRLWFAGNSSTLVQGAVMTSTIRYCIFFGFVRWSRFFGYRNPTLFFLYFFSFPFLLFFYFFFLSPG
ncbi:hypothetical protein BDV37DRAFT_267402 [Aspergillus pseudonomiae]|uniref:Uncharacterized protein n=1 Tax=Aspergillus pseudonomiae TaxID=1506151 RepID=A0A5N7CR95_9EURO|nr:uncharacterized protein BDV37DRAFT_267402 [Aspergillus pseudonomiae]KAE8396770.1 hypothetical protein BDV37DRAFT_267402 [Aspergillus pseudonomiae]